MTATKFSNVLVYVMVFVLGFMLCQSALAQEASQSKPQRLDKLEERIAELESQLQDRARAKEPIPDSSDTHEAEAWTTPTWLRQLQPFGLLQMDTGFFRQSRRNKAQVGDAANGAEVRRARLGVRARFNEQFSATMEIDFAVGKRVSLVEVYLEMKQVPVLGRLRLGQWRHPFSAEALTSIRNLSFLERALPFTFAPFRQIGLGFLKGEEDSRWTCAGSVFGFPSDPFAGNAGDIRGPSASGRATFALWRDLKTREAFSIGLSAAYLTPSNRQLRYATPPEFSVGETGGGITNRVATTVPAFVDTGILKVDTSVAGGLEAIWSLGPFHAMAEVLATELRFRNSTTSATFTGAYAEAGYALTGESRPFLFDHGVLGALVPEHDFGGGWGALELVSRVSWLDFHNRSVQGGQLLQITGGLNWILNKYLKAQLNLSEAQVKQQRHSHAEIAMGRVQVQF